MEATEVAIVEATEVAIVEATEVVIVEATEVVILNPMLLIAANPQEQKAGKIEAMETLLKTLNLKVEEVGEKEAFLVRVIPQIIQISILFLVAY